jgi:hypothetical protein
MRISEIRDEWLAWRSDLLPKTASGCGPLLQSGEHAGRDVDLAPTFPCGFAEEAPRFTRRLYLHPWFRSGPPSRAFPAPGMDNQRLQYQLQPTIQTDPEGGSKRWIRSLRLGPG